MSAIVKEAYDAFKDAGVSKQKATEEQLLPITIQYLKKYYSY